MMLERPWLMAVGPCSFLSVTGFPMLLSEAPLHYILQRISSVDTAMMIKLFCYISTVNLPPCRKR